MNRCRWCVGDLLLEAYHDQEWGIPVDTDEELFERLVLEMFQAGLSWRTILYKRDAFREAFFEFDVARIAAMTEDEVNERMMRKEIVRNRKKIEAAIFNAKECLKLIGQHGSLKNYLETLKRYTLEEKQKEFRKRFKFMGPLIAEAFFQSVGMIDNLHEPGCWKYESMTDRQEKTPTVWVIGAGAVGSVLAAILNRHIPVVLVGDSPHARKVKEDGLRIALYNEPEMVVRLDVRASAEVQKLKPEDLVLLTGKIWGIQRTAAWLRPLLHPQQWVAALQNGMGFEEDAASQMGIPLQRGIVQFGANSSGQGDVQFYRGKLIFPPSHHAQMLRGWMADGPIDCEITEHFLEAQWNKLLINCVANPLAGLLQINNRQISNPQLDDVKKHILEEVKKVAAVQGVYLDLDIRSLNRYFRSENVPSLVRDLQRGQPTEVEYINGYIVREGLRHGIEAPVNQALTAMIDFLSGQSAERKEVSP